MIYNVKSQSTILVRINGVVLATAVLQIPNKKPRDGEMGEYLIHRPNPI